jgi:pSer/pThr/pTyr-binding forkhead associated (FHA) protein
MAKYWNDDKNNIVTIFNRTKIRPAIDTSTRPAEGDLPKTVYFVLPSGEECPADTGNEIIIGRQSREDDPPVTVDLEGFDGHSLGISRHHCMMKSFKGYLILVDLDSINGTFINGKRAMPLKRYALVDGDTITVGRLTLELRYRKRNRR